MSVLSPRRAAPPPLRDRAEQIAASLPPLLVAAERVAMNRVTDQAASATPLLSYKGIVEVAAGSRREIDAILTAAAVKADLVVVARECLLWDTDLSIKVLSRPDKGKN